MYKVVKSFQDLQDNRYSYQAGDTFPREGFKPSKERLEELSSINNRRHTILIKKVDEPKVEVKVEPEVIEEKIEEPAEKIIAESEQPIKKPRKNRRNKEK